jgi:hypothetical protein
VTVDDEGEFLCAIRNQKGEDLASAQLKVEKGELDSIEEGFYNLHFR